MLCFQEVFQQRTENEFDAERRILKASGIRNMANLVARVLSSPPYGKRKLNTVRLKSSDLFHDLCKAEVLMASYPQALSTELVSLRAAFTNFLWTLHNISASMKNIYIYSH